MNGRELFTQGNWNSRRTKHYLDYSRHMWDTAITSSLAVKRLSKSFSDTDAIRHRKKAGTIKSNLETRRQTLASLRGSTSQTKVVSLDLKFHKKYGKKMDNLETPRETSKTVSSKEDNRSLVNLTSRNSAEDARSFCDSVSSMACSNVTKAEVIMSTRDSKSNDNSSGSISKFEAIEKWLQYLPKPVL